MSAFVLKIIAVVSMLIDHIGLSMLLGGIIKNNIIYSACRIAGRLSLPIFCFMLVNGFEKTGDRKKYLTRLCLFAIFSQIPFTLAFNAANYSPEICENGICFSYKTFLFLLIPLAVYLFFVLKRKVDASLAILSAALVLSCLELQINGYVLVSNHLNIFYTLAFSLAILMSAERIFHGRDVRLYEKLLIISADVIALLFIQANADYGYMGVLLTLMLYIARDQRILQCVSVTLWAFAESSVTQTGLLYALGIASSAIPIYLYNGQRGKNIKLFFYIFYPVHLLLLFLIIKMSSAK